MKKSSVPDNTIGKVISSLNWYIACEITADEATDLTLWGDDVTVDFPTHHQIRYQPRFIKLFSTITQIKHL